MQLKMVLAGHCEQQKVVDKVLVVQPFPYNSQ
jgi:hypothetical protein